MQSTTEHGNGPNGWRYLMNDPDLLKMSDVAELLGVPIATLRYWRHCGTGPRSFRLGRRVAYVRADVLAWIERQAVGASSSG